jgi:LysM repeat protein
MNIRCAVLLCTLSVASVVTANETEIQFAGVLTAAGKTRIALTDTATKTTTWVEPGGEYKGYRVTRYDPKEEAVFLDKGGRETRLGLVAAKTPNSPDAAKDAAASVQTATAVRSNLRQLVSAARQNQLQRGVGTVNYSDLVGPDKLIKELKPIAGEDYSTLSFGPNVTAVSVTTENGITIAYEMPSASVDSRATATAAAAATPAPPASPAPAVAPPPPGPVTISRVIENPASATPAGQAPAVPASAEEPLQPTGRQPVSPSYMVQGGDTWETISRTTGVPVQQLKELNPAILQGSPLPAGQTIRVR